MSEYTIKNLNVDTRIDRCTDADSSRYALGGVRMVRESETEATLYATDGKCLAVTKASADHIDDSYSIVAIPPKAIPRRANSARKTYRRLSLNGRWENGDGKLCDMVDDCGRFPNIGQIMPDVSAEDTLIHIDVNLLANLAESITDAGKPLVLTLCVKDPQHAIGVIGSHGVGVIMPLIFSDKKRLATDMSTYRDYRERAMATDFSIE